MASDLRQLAELTVNAIPTDVRLEYAMMLATAVLKEEPVRVHTCAECFEAQERVGLHCYVYTMPQYRDRPPGPGAPCPIRRAGGRVVLELDDA